MTSEEDQMDTETQQPTSVDEPLDEIPPSVDIDDASASPEESEMDEAMVEIDPLEQALQRAEAAEKEIAYRDAEIQNVRKRLLAEKAEVIQYGSMGLARRMLDVLADVDRALQNVDDSDESPLAVGLRLLRNKTWHELSSDGVIQIEAKGQVFEPVNMEAVTTIPASEQFPAGIVVEVLEAGYMYKAKVIRPARVVVATEV